MLWVLRCYFNEEKELLRIKNLKIEDYRLKIAEFGMRIAECEHRIKTKRNFKFQVYRPDHRISLKFGA